MENLFQFNWIAQNLFRVNGIGQKYQCISVDQYSSECTPVVSSRIIWHFQNVIHIKVEIGVYRMTSTSCFKASCNSEPLGVNSKLNPMPSSKVSKLGRLTLAPKLKNKIQIQIQMYKLVIHKYKERASVRDVKVFQ